MTAARPGPPWSMKMQAGRSRPGTGQRTWTEDRLDPLPDDIDVDADRRQRIPVERVGCTLAAGRTMGTGESDELLLISLWGHPSVAQNRTGLAVHPGQSVQQMLASEEVVPQAPCLFLGEHDDLTPLPRDTP